MKDVNRLTNNDFPYKNKNVRRAAETFSGAYQKNARKLFIRIAFWRF